MADDMIPEDIQQFIRSNIDSVATLEALLLLRSRPDQEWSGELLARRLYLPLTRLNGIMAALLARGFCFQPDPGQPRYRFKAASEELKASLDRLAELYTQHLIAITALIHAHNGLPEPEPFSDAFRLKQKPEDS